MYKSLYTILKCIHLLHTVFEVCQHALVSRKIQYTYTLYMYVLPDDSFGIHKASVPSAHNTYWKCSPTCVQCKWISTHLKLHDSLYLLHIPSHTVFPLQSSYLPACSNHQHIYIIHSNRSLLYIINESTYHKLTVIQ